MEDLAVVLDNANVSRLFLDGISSVSIDLVKKYAARNNDIVCLSLNRCAIREKDLMEFFPNLGHGKLQVLMLPSGRRLAFSGENHWIATVSAHKFSNVSRIDISLSSGAPYVSYFKDQV